MDKQWPDRIIALVSTIRFEISILWCLDEMYGPVVLNRFTLTASSAVKIMLLYIDIPSDSKKF